MKELAEEGEVLYVGFVLVLVVVGGWVVDSVEAVAGVDYAVDGEAGEGGVGYYD
jgi:hypothetical protein